MKLSLSTLITLLLVLGFALPNLQAQRNCGAMEHLEYQQQQDPKLEFKMQNIERHTQQYLQSNGAARVTGIITIPVVFHVVYNNSTENISDAQIQSQLDVLNEDFRRTNSDANGTWSQAADTEIEFCLATVDPSGNATTGITRTSTSQTSFGTNDQMKFNSSGGKDAWPAADYLNFWVCDISGGILGYAQFPGGSAATDGVVCDYQYVGTIGTATAPFDLGRTATHEVGHWLNLRHIWGDGNCNVDDFVADTPTSDNPNYGCATGHVSCSSTDMVENYMDYSDDACMNLYTAGQTARMRALFDPGGFRESLLSSAACGTPPPPPTCDDNIQNGDETGVDCGGSSCPACVCNGTEVTVTINLDNYPEETSWQITDGGGAVVASGGTYGSQPDGSTVVITECLADGCYDFTILDSYGDGICCGYGNGSYTVTGGGSTLASGGSFGSSETTNFCLGGGPAPTCTDGIQNGGETDIDCGGPDCDPCPTCNDGMQNGDETGVDCGGSCPPCGGGGCTYTGVDLEDFEGGWGMWNDGGSDCRRSARDAAYADGTFCVRLRDNTSTSTTTTDNLNLSSYDELTVDFRFYPRSMETGEDFWLQVSTNGGGSYTTVATFAQGTDFSNNQIYNASVIIPGPFSANTRLRFRNDASGNSDWIYLDNIDVTGCLNANREMEAPEVTVSPSLDDTIQDLQVEPSSSIQLFPNPTRDQINLDFTLEQHSASVQLILTDMNGKVIEQRPLSNQLGQQRVQVDMSSQAPGIYLVQIITDQERLTEKFVVIR